MGEKIIKLNKEQFDEIIRAQLEAKIKAMGHFAEVRKTIINLFICQGVRKEFKEVKS